MRSLDEAKYGLRVFDSLRCIGTLWYTNYATLLRVAEGYLRHGRRVEYCGAALLDGVVDAEVIDGE